MRIGGVSDKPIGGFTSKGRILFPNAALHVLQTEVDFWRGKEPDFSKSHRTDDIKGMIKSVRNSFDTLQPNLVLHKDGDQILDGAITILAAPGHTDGHAIYRIKSDGQSLLHLSDLAHNHILMLEDPNWFIDFDHNPEVAIASRKKAEADLEAASAALREANAKLAAALARIAELEEENRRLREQPRGTPNTSPNYRVL